MTTLGLVVVFWVLFAGVLGAPAGRAALRRRGWQDWVLDLAGLAVQGTLVPVLTLTLAAGVWPRLIPGGTLAVGWLGGFVLNFVVVDYLYYWNHRLLHRAWPVHRVHHGAPAMDVLVTSRNTLWTSLLIVYVWVNSLLLHVVDVPEGVAAGVGLTAALDLWRHSPMGGRIPGFVSPVHHAWHHSEERQDVNFGANWNWWDRLHGTWLDVPTRPARLGVPTHLGLLRSLLWPWS